MSRLKDAEKYVGMAYVADQFDCADLAALVQSELFGRMIGLPVHRRGRLTQAAQINNMKDNLATRVGYPVDGTACLFTSQTESGLLWHIGTCFVNGSDVWILHNSKSVGSTVLMRSYEMTRRGLVFEGFYEWK